jgi:hypothetical protein
MRLIVDLSLRRPGFDSTPFRVGSTVDRESQGKVVVRRLQFFLNNSLYQCYIFVTGAMQFH